ncbi:hypothetical protein MKW98_001989, partial [Papaver atlanticum]
MFFQEATCDADNWTDVNKKYRDRRSFHGFLDLLETSGMEKYASNEMDIGCPSSDVVVTNKCYDGSMSLIKLLRRIRSESGDHFRREQQEQRFIAKSFSEHLEQLRKFGEVAFSSNAVNDDDGDRHKCPII